MSYVIIVFFTVAELFVFYGSVTRRFNNPYTLDVYFGKKGCGKSTTLNKLAFKYYKKGWTCFCDRGDSFQSFVRTIDASKMYQYKYPPNSVIFVGEANLYWDNRDFKDFPKEMQRFFRMQRHKRVKVILFSQTYDTDKKIRDLADRLYIVRKRFKMWSCCAPYVKVPKIIPASETRDTARMADDFLKISIFTLQHVITFIPAWIGNFDSFGDAYGPEVRVDLTLAPPKPPQEPPAPRDRERAQK